MNTKDIRKVAIAAVALGAVLASQSCTNAEPARQGVGKAGLEAISFEGDEKDGADCTFPDGTLPEQWIYVIPGDSFETALRANGDIYVKCGPATVSVGVQNDGPDQAPPAPPTASGTGTVSVYKLTNTGSELVLSENGGPTVAQGNPFLNGCYVFRVGMYVDRDRPSTLQAGDWIDVFCETRFTVTRYTGTRPDLTANPSILAIGSGSARFQL